MAVETASTKQITLEEQSELVKKLSFELRNDLDDFFSLPQATGGKVETPVLKVDVIARIAVNLTQAENALKDIAQQFCKLRARISA